MKAAAGSWPARRAGTLRALLLGIVYGAVQPALLAADPAGCAAFPSLDGTASEALQAVTPPTAGGCTVRLSKPDGMPLPDPACTPGAINPTLTLEVLQTPGFTTKCVRSHASSDADKAKTYEQYAITHPAQNSGVTQSCELDHLISLELGGADTVDNIWPQCGPGGVVLVERYFKQKDAVENYLAKQVREGLMDLGEVQKGIASDWTQYLEAAHQACPLGKCR